MTSANSSMENQSCKICKLAGHISNECMLWSANINNKSEWEKNHETKNYEKTKLNKKNFQPIETEQTEYWFFLYSDTLKLFYSGQTWNSYA